MTEFAQNYGALIFALFSLAVSIGTFWVILRGVNEWKKQKRVAFAERYHDALWEIDSIMTKKLRDAIIRDIYEDAYWKPINPRQDAFFLETLFDLEKQNNQFTRSATIFPQLEKDIITFFQTIGNIEAETKKLVSEITADGQTSTRDENTGQMIDKAVIFFSKESALIQTFITERRKIDKHLTAYIARNLK